MKNLAITLAFLLSAAISAHAATFTVTNANDSGAGSLRQALTDVQTQTSGDHTIEFDTAFFNQPRVIVMAGGQYSVVFPAGINNLRIKGPGANLLTINANNQSRIFNIFHNGWTEITGITLTGGRAGSGGAIFAQSSLFVRDMVFTGNTATGELFEPNAPQPGGGAIHARFMMMNNCHVTGNTAAGTNIPGGGSPPFGTGMLGGGIYLRPDGQSYINNSVISGNSAIGGNAIGDQEGGRGGSAFGGGIYHNAGVLQINNTTINNNFATGGFASTTGPISIGGLGVGAGLFSTGTTLIYGSTISNNHATGGNATSGTGGPASGGGIFADVNQSDIRMINSTISGNMLTRGSGQTVGQCSGGGFYKGVAARLINVTITNHNVPDCAGGGMYVSIAGNAPSLGNTIIAGNNAISGRDAWGAVNSLGNNVIGISNDLTGITNGTNGDQAGTTAAPLDAKLGAMADNGGPTRTHALLKTSPAINTGRNSLATYFSSTAPLAGDQRGYARFSPVAGTVDVGAFEFGSTSVAVTSAPDLTVASDTGVSNFDDVSNATAPIFTVNNVVPGATVELLRNGAVVGSILTNENSVSVADASSPADGVFTYATRQVVGTSTSASGNSLQVTLDYTAPLMTVSLADGQADPATTAPVRFSITGNEATFYAGGPWSFAGSTANLNNAFAQLATNGNIHTLTVGNIWSPGLVAFALHNGAFRDRAGNLNFAPTIVDNTVNFQPAPRTVVITGQVRKSAGRVPAPGVLVIARDVGTGQTFRAAANPSGFYRLVVTGYVGIASEFEIQIKRRQTVLLGANIVADGNSSDHNYRIEY